MVSNPTLAAISVLNGLHRHLRHSSDDLAKAFTTFEIELLQLQAKERREAQMEKRPFKQYWLELSPSKVSVHNEPRPTSFLDRRCAGTLRRVRSRAWRNLRLG